jgi:hypothetical protein
MSMKKEHVMIDIETLGTSVDSAIIQIGAMRFNMYPDPYAEIGCFSRIISLDSNTALGRKVDQGTLNWWLDTDHTLFRRMLKSGSPLGEVLSRLSWFLMESHYVAVWANGTDFDIAVLKHAYKQCLNTNPPWAYNAVRDCRTIYKLYGHLVERCDNGTKHDALDDCRNQAIYLDSVLRPLGGGGLVR